MSNLSPKNVPGTFGTLFYNPTHGAVADFTELVLDTVVGPSSLSRQLGRLSTQLRVDLVGYSQGSLIASNALLYAASKGGVVAGSTIAPYGAVVGGMRLGLSAALSGATVTYGQIKAFDPAKLLSSEINPMGYVQGAMGLLNGGKQHFGYFNR